MFSKISTILFLLFCVSFAFAQNEFKVISSSRNAIVVEYSPSFDTSSIKINNQKFIQVNLSRGYIDSHEPGLPAIYRRAVQIGVPSEFGNTIRVLSTSHKELHGKIAPVPKAVQDKNNMTSFVYDEFNNYQNSNSSYELVTFGEFGNLRGIPTQSIIFSPVQFNPSQNSIKIYTKIVFQINFSSNQKIARVPADDFAAGAILNFDAARYWTNENNSRRLKKVDNSVLAAGKWVKFETPEEGIYKITYDMLSDYGINAASVDPRTIKIYNNGGKMLPENVNTQRPEDLVENAIIVSGEADGKFNENDYILFYGRGNSFWDYDTTSKRIERYFHLYSKVNYYWITSGGAQGKRIQNKASLNEVNHFTQSFTYAFAQWEEDKINIMQSGRIFLGDEFSESTTSRTYMNKLEGRIDNTSIEYKFNVVNASSGSVNLAVFENSSRIFTRTIGGYGSPDSYLAGISLTSSVSFNPDLTDDRSLLKFQFNLNSPNSKAYLNYFEITYQKQLRAFNDYLMFFSMDTTALIEYDLSGFSSTGIMVFDVTDYSNVKLISNPVMQSGGEFRFQANETSGNLSKYIATANNFKTPANPVEIDNQNLHAVSPGAKFIIITDKAFQDEAVRLKNFKESRAEFPISTIVVDVEKIYNEFSGGILDVTAIRDFIKYAYDFWTVKPEYILLFGDGNYDYKNITGTKNFIPPYETEEYLYEIYSYPMDDYYVRVAGNDSRSDLAVGRLNIQSLEDARICVNKIIDYETNDDKGLWRSLITLVADDGPTTEGNDGSRHTGQSEELAALHIPDFFDVNKIYLAAYPTVITGFGRTKPAVNQAIIDAINQGSLIMNFIGHGSDELWAHENVFVSSSTIPQLNNDRYFLLSAATCGFGYFDKTEAQSGAELLILKEGSGAIGVFTATRPVYSDQNSDLNNAFFDKLLNSQSDTLSYTIPIGKAFYLAKSSRTNVNDNKFHYFGDPTVRLLVPEQDAEIDSVNGQFIGSTAANVQLKALSSVQISGVIKKPDNTVWSDFNGEAIVSVFDSERKVPLEQLHGYTITLQGGTIFRGRVSVTNGKFDANFVVPKDISYQNENGKIIVYFFNENVDGIGFTDDIIVGGSDSSAANDGDGPDLKIYFDRVSENNSYLVNPDSKLIVELSDETGLNTTGTGVGHTLEGILNGKVNDPIDFTNYFTGDLNSAGKSGKINYGVSSLEKGDYELEIHAWDVFNNFSSETTYFTIVNGDKLVIRDIYNYPNPFSLNTSFTFQQNLNMPLNLKIKIYTIAGRLIKIIERNGIRERFVTVPWNGRDEDGSIIANGTYLYKIIVKTVDGKYSETALGKLAVIR